ncbi:MAG TPA: lipopolysaccharide heptosyltransferase family protein [Deltaproteobacteria bacterium]|nr:lipopolysaccharide heptosyltransferase family protein [Deltaproteobacteria bacterium]
MEGLNKILLVRKDNIGDLVCTTPALRALRRRYPRARIGLLTNSYAAPVVEGNPDVDDLYVYTKEKHSGRGRLAALTANAAVMMRIRRARYDVALGCGSWSPSLARYVLLTGAPVRIGYRRGGGGRLCYTTRLAEPQEPLHEVEKTFRLLAPLGIEGEPGPMVLAADEEERRRCASFLTARGRRGSRPLFAVSISARIDRNRWPIEKFATLIEEIAEKGLADVMVLWAPGRSDDPRFPGDDEKAQRLVALCGPPVFALPTPTLKSLAAALSLSDLVVTLDTGSLHMAAALGKPVAALMTRAKSLAWRPWKTRAAVVAAPESVETITVEEVMEAVTGLAEEAFEGSAVETGP